eukprot:CAMPEP_0177759646 /NCGR_PEP_ID=MMETSP0491_2-20121128/4842_1 /TAXON_ID=63592 /ORGANISM="Tetraselmis chuii, Strain PLY429" /LENGTH=999 /DNA_ID=CAMNT_0019275487 /DNA_START=135 /DNA_END=3134 /DNA_ORIENTATION=-
MVYRLGVRTKGRHDMCGGRASGRGSSYDTRFLSVVLTFYALTQLAAAAPANLTLCMHTKLNEGNLTLPAELLAAVAAIDDVNRRDCRVLGSDAPCTRLPAGFGLKELLVGVRGSGAGSAARAAEECVSLGADAVVGPADGEHAALVALVTQAAGLPVLSYNSTSPLLSDEVVTPQFARTTFSDAVVANASVSLFREMNWAQVAVLHECTSAAHALTESLANGAAEAAVTVHPFATCGTGVRLRDNLLRIKAAGLKVVLVLGLSRELGSILAEAEALQLLSLDHRFLHAATYPHALLSEQNALPTAARSLRLTQSNSASVKALQERLSEMTADDIGEVLLQGGDGMQELVQPTLPSAPNGTTLSSWTPLAAYDAVWGIALAGALVSPDGSSPDSVGSRMYAKLVSSDVGFEGASGEVSWEANGDRAATGAAVDFKLVSAAENGVLKFESLAEWSVSGGIVVSDIWTNLSNSDAMVTQPESSNCSACPIESCGAGFSGWSMALGLALGVAMSAALLACWALWRRYQKRRVAVQPPLSPTVQRRKSRLSLSRKKTGTTPFQSRSIEVVDLESPLAKMLQFLRRCEAAPPWLRPRGAEARALRELIEKSDDLLSPNLQRSLGLGLDGYSPYSEGVAQYLLHQTSVAPTPSGNRKMTMKTYSASSMRPSDSSVAGEEASNGTGHGEGDRRKLLEIPFVDIVDVDAHQFEVSSPKDVKVPIASLDCIGLDFTLDFVNPDSMMRRCNEALVVVMKQAVASLELDSCLKTRQSILRLLSLARRLESGYMEGGYHNRFHAADVTNRLACVLRHSGISAAAQRSSSQSCQLLAAIVAACAHDFEHPQLTNGFLVETEEPMAIAFNFQAVAENHSLRTSLALMSQTEYNFVEEWEAGQAKEFKRAVIRMVLATDMSRHFELLVQYRTKVVNSEAVRGKTGREAFAAMDVNQRMMTLQMAMKVADLGHCMLPTEQHARWVEALQEEMFRQGDREKELHLEVSPLMDREKTG